VRLGAALAALATALLATGCVRLRWSQENRFEPLAEAARAASFVPGRTDLSEVLEGLGAPLFVWEQTSERFAVAYGWFHGRSAGATLSVPVSDSLSASLSYDDLAERLYGLVLTFDADCRLELLREGYLRELAPELFTRRPSFDPAWVEGGPAAE
jgi:hypothetical protein